jgi:hypothetical protein
MSPARTPNTKPPTWAVEATPLIGLTKNCDTNQKPRTQNAGMSTKKNVTRVRIRARGNHTR